MAVIIGIVGVAVAAVLYMFNNLIFDGVIVRSLQWISVYGRFGNFVSGVLNLADIVYYVSFTLLFIYLAINVIEKRRWR